MKSRAACCRISSDYLPGATQQSGNHLRKVSILFAYEFFLQFCVHWLDVSIRDPWALTLCLRTNLAIHFWPKFQTRFSKLPYLGMKLGHPPKFQKLPIYPLSTSGGGGCPKLSYFRSMSSSFRDMGRFSKWPYLGMKVGYWPKCQKSHILCEFLSTPGGQN